MATGGESMRAVILETEGKPEALTVGTVARPTPAPGEVRIAIRRSALNHLDLWIRRGMPSVPRPRIMGADGMGVIDAVGAGVGAVRVGERVLVDPSITCGTCPACARGETVLCSTYRVVGEHVDGTHAEFVCVPDANALAVPPHLSDDEAAALPLVFATAWRMLFTRARLAPGERVLVWGASSGVGSAAVQLAHHHGARVIATTRSAVKADSLVSLGADHVVDTASDDVVATVTDAFGTDGVDVVFDHLGEVAWAPSLKLLTKGGRLVTCGATTGANPPAQITRIFWKQLSVMGSTMASKRDVADMLRFVSEHDIHPVVDRTFDLDGIVEAHRHLESAHGVGKVVIRVAG